MHHKHTQPLQEYSVPEFTTIETTQKRSEMRKETREIDVPHEGGMMRERIAKENPTQVIKNQKTMKYSLCITPSLVGL